MLEKKIVINGKETDYTIREDGTVISPLGRNLNKATRVFSEDISGSSRKVVCVHLKIDGKYYVKTVHHLLAEAFIPNPEHYKNVDFINGDSTDLRLGNLYWTNKRRRTRNKEQNIINTRVARLTEALRAISRREPPEEVSEKTGVSLRDVLCLKVIYENEESSS